MAQRKVVRRSPISFWSDTAHIVVVSLAVLLVILTALTVMEKSFRYVWIDLQSVTVPDHGAAEDPEVTAHRIIRRNYRGSWSTTIRRAGDHRLICVAHGFEISYRRAANVVQPIRMALSEWMLDRAALDRCVGAGFRVGKFYLSTCHHAVVATIIPVTRCVDSNVFEKGGRGM